MTVQACLGNILLNRLGYTENHCHTNELGFSWNLKQVGYLMNTQGGALGGKVASYLGPGGEQGQRAVNMFHSQLEKRGMCPLVHRVSQS